MSMFFECCFVNVETRHEVNFNFQLNIIAKMTLMKVEDQRCFNADLKLLFCWERKNPL